MPHPRPGPPFSCPEPFDRIDRGLDTLHGSDDVAQTARAAGVPHLARTALRRDVLAHAFHRMRRTVRLNLVANGCFCFAEAVADQPIAEWLLLPHGDAHIAAAITRAECVEVHHVARWI